MKWIRGYGTRFVWNSVMSTFRAPSNRRDAVKLEIIWAMRRFRLVYVGRSMSRFLKLKSPRVAENTVNESFFISGRGSLLACQGHQSKKASEARAEMPSANVVQRLVVVHNCDVRMLEERMHAQDLVGCSAAQLSQRRSVWEKHANRPRNPYRNT